MSRVVTFDFDGVIVDSFDRFYERLLEARPDHVATSPEELIRVLTNEEET